MPWADIKLCRSVFSFHHLYRYNLTNWSYLYSVRIESDSRVSVYQHVENKRNKNQEWRSQKSKPTCINHTNLSLQQSHKTALQSTAAPLVAKILRYRKVPSLSNRKFVTLSLCSSVEAGIVLNLFLNSGQTWASCSYKKEHWESNIGVTASKFLLHSRQNTVNRRDFVVMSPKIRYTVF